VKWLARHGSGERTHISHVLAILPDYRGNVPPMLVTCAQRLLCLPRMLAHRISAIRSEMGVRSSMSNHGHQSGDHSHGLGPYWKRAHRDWRFWVGVLFMSVALIVYVMSDDLSLVPRIQPRQTSPSAASQ
jgi:hypothetical protein